MPTLIVDGGLDDRSLTAAAQCICAMSGVKLEIAGTDKSAEYTKLAEPNASPAKGPALYVGQADLVLYGKSAILRTLARLSPEKDLSPMDPFSNALGHQWITWAESEIDGPVAAIRQYGSLPTATRVVATFKDKLSGMLQELDTALASTTFLASDDFPTAADAAVFGSLFNENTKGAVFRQFDLMSANNKHTNVSRWATHLAHMLPFTTLASEAGFKTKHVATQEAPPGLIAKLEDLIRRNTVIETETAALAERIGKLAGPKQGKAQGKAQAAAGQADKAATAPAAEAASNEDPKVVADRMTRLCGDAGIPSGRGVVVPTNWYDLTLTERKEFLSLESEHQLCKSLVLRNTKRSGKGMEDRTNSEFYLVIVQYTGRFNSEKMQKFVREVNGKLGKKHFNFQFVPPEVSDELTGYKHNSVSPFGLAQPVPIILSKAIVDLPHDTFVVGGGAGDVKVMLKIKEFVEKCDPLVGDIIY